jgi:hypothetical protein
MDFLLYLNQMFLKLLSCYLKIKIKMIKIFGEKKWDRDIVVFNNII